MLQSMDFRVLWPQPGTVEIEQYLAGLELSQRASAERPFTVANFVSSIDGRASVDGRSDPLGDPGDKALFHGLRREVDAILVGTGTLRAERYGRIIRDPAVRDRRRERGLRPEPLTCVVTRSGSVPLDIPLFAEPEAQILIFSGAELDTSGVQANVTVVTVPPQELSFAAVLTRLRTEHDVLALLCEGGPYVFGALLTESLIDQLFLTFSPQIVGGGNAPTIASGPGLPEPAQMALEGLLERDQTLFLRYTRSS
jgi:riboflavin-specific deaminase-like protein